MKFCRNFADNLENVTIMLKFSEIFEFSRENSYFERIRMVRTVQMVRMVRSLADRTFQLWSWPSFTPARSARRAAARTCAAADQRDLKSAAFRNQLIAASLSRLTPSPLA